MTAFVATLMPVFSDSLVGNGACFANEGDENNTPLWPNIVPVYDSYYDYSDGILYIYGGVQDTQITVEVTHNGQTVLFDVLSPNNLPTQYDFNGSDNGGYQVTILTGDTLLTTFCFILF